MDFRSLKIKHEEQFKYEVQCELREKFKTSMKFLCSLCSKVNEISWNKENDHFFLTNGNGCVVILRFAILLLMSLCEYKKDAALETVMSSLVGRMSSSQRVLSEVLNPLLLFIIVGQN